jgi:hypothetical protein
VTELVETPVRPRDRDVPVAVPVRDRELEVAATIARWMDRRFLDPVLGLVLPGVGDLFSALLGLYPVVLAARRRAPKILLARMLLNLSADALGGAIPIVGDIWDFLFRAHSRNHALLQERARDGGEIRTRPTDVLVVAGAGLLFLAALAAPIVVAILVVRAIMR